MQQFQKSLISLFFSFFSNTLFSFNYLAMSCFSSKLKEKKSKNIEMTRFSKPEAQNLNE